MAKLLRVTDPRAGGSASGCALECLGAFPVLDKQPHGCVISRMLKSAFKPLVGVVGPASCLSSSSSSEDVFRSLRAIPPSSGKMVPPYFRWNRLQHRDRLDSASSSSSFPKGVFGAIQPLSTLRGPEADRINRIFRIKFCPFG